MPQLGDISQVLGTCLSVLVARGGGELVVTGEEMAQHGGKLLLEVDGEKIVLKVLEETVN
jgi:hypothetical protein